MLDWNTKGENQVAQYRGFKITAVHDSCPENPFESWDGHLPMLVYYDGRLEDHGTGGDELKSVLQRFTPEHLIYAQVQIAKLFDTTVRTMMSNFLDEGANWCEDPDGAVDWCEDGEQLRQMFQIELDEVSNSRLIDTLDELFKLLGIKTANQYSRGYCQGDVAEVLVVATPEEIEKGWGKDYDIDPSVLTGQIDLYGAWAWGNCWGYVVTDPKTGKELDSCWGYYGDHDDSGLEEAATTAVDGIIHHIRKRRLSRLAELVRNRVPLIYRKELLDEAGILPA